MSQYEVKSGKTVFFVNAEDKADAVHRFRQSCGIYHIDAVTYVNDSNTVLNNVIDRYEEERSLYFDYWQPKRKKMECGERNDPISRHEM